MYVYEESKNTIENKGNNFRVRQAKKNQKWPEIHHFWNCGHNMPKTNTKIDMDHISVIINICVEFEKNLRGCILEISKMVKLAKMAIKWPKLENGFFHSKNGFFID